MSLIKWNSGSDVFPNLTSVFDDFFGKDLLAKSTVNKTVPPVNVQELDDAFEIEMAAPGYKKNDFKIDLDGDYLLSISVEKEDKNEVKDKKMTRQEYSFSSFRRVFTLPETANADKIEASYENGLLKIHIDKKEEVINKPHRQIDIH